MSSAQAEAEQPQHVDQVAPEVAEQAEDAASPAIDLVLLIPAQSFLNLAESPASKTSDGYLQLPFTSNLTDLVQDLKTIIVEAPEGFWLGAFSLAPLYAEEIPSSVQDDAQEGEEEQQYGEWKAVVPPPAKENLAEVDGKQWTLTNEGVLGDLAELSAVFGAEPEFWQGKRRGLKVAFTAFTPLAMHQHLLKVRDVLFSNLPTLASTPCTYDPTSLAIAPGVSLYQKVRGEQGSDAESLPVVDEDVVEEKPSKGAKKGKATKKTAPAPTESVQPTTSSNGTIEPSTHAFTGFKLEDLESSEYLKYLGPAASTAATSPCIKALGVSPWSPPPHHRRVRGDLVYLNISTLESETYSITGSIAGFWVSKMTASNFDPSPRAVLPRGVRQGAYHSLFELLSDISPSFRKNLTALIAKVTRPDFSQSDLVASCAITNTLPAAPYLVPAPLHAADPLRTQAAYLLTGSTTAEQLPSARDWNDDFGQFYDLPRTDDEQRLMRERLISRTQADLVLAATRGAMQVARGDVPPINPNEPLSAHTFIHNNLLFTKAEDSIGLYTHGLGGNEASRYAAGKDLKGIELLERLDIDGLSMMQTVLVDFQGSRWIVQTLIPGLFKAGRDEAEELAAQEEEKLTGKKPAAKPARVYPEGDEAAQQAAKTALAEDKPFPSEETANKFDYPPTSSFRIIYGAADPEDPDAKIRNAAYFHENLAKKVAKKMRFAEHNVKDREGNEVSLWTASDMHGIAAPDGRSYFIDCFRLHCVDIEFREQNVAASDALAAYPHRLVLLRPELLELYRDHKLQPWLEEQVEKTRANLEKANKSVEAELKEAAADPKEQESENKDENAKPATTSIINADDFVLDFNPDAFVERKPVNGATNSEQIHNEEEEATKNVRLASQYLREVALKAFLIEAGSATLNITDGFLMTRLLHRKGINMRYIGMLADKIDQEGSTYEFSKGTSKSEALYTLELLKHTLRSEMVIRAAKHILNGLLRSSGSFDHAYIVAHFLNCLLGSAFNPAPVAETPYLPSENVTRAWTALTPPSLRAELIKEISSRFRYSLSEEWFDVELVKNKTARELCLRVGVQLVARAYNFGSSSAEVSTPAAEVAPKPSPEESSSTKKKSNKKKSGKASANGADATKASLPAMSFTADDVLNIMPVVKSTAFKSALVEERFAQGQRALSEAYVEAGEQLTNEALSYCDQVFGTVHPEAASKCHSLGLIWHSLSQRLLTSVQRHELAEQALKEFASLPKSEELDNDREVQIREMLLPNVEAARAEAESYLQAAVRMVRQSIVVCERTSGLDAHDTLQQYTDLGLLEQAAGNVEVGLRLSKHAMDLWRAAYGPAHPALVSILANVAAIVQSTWGPADALPLVLEQRKLAETVYGADSVAVGQAEFALGQAYALNSDLVGSLEHMKAAQTILSKHLGEDAKEAAEATNLVRFIEQSVAREDMEQRAREERLKNKFPTVNGNRPVASATSAPAARQAPVNGAKEAAAATAPRQHGQKANLSVDELVDFIQGSSSSSSSSKNKNKQRK
ncbi:translation initiation factor 3 subunit CLU1 [Sporobolomyces koalae]|uniref:translation initiation factor 3 subunit CLU1 n=1 Tax=Sporobolomyces koalae TaxID=500713 RepID=UPI003181125A